MKRRVGAWALLAATSIGASAVSRAQDVPLYKQASATVEARVDDLLGRMTLEEKVAQVLVQSTIPIRAEGGAPTAAGIFTNGQLDEGIAKQVLSEGIGAFTLIERVPPTLRNSAVQLNLIQSWLLKNTRLGIPTLFHVEGLHGLAASEATSFPQAIALGSTWDRALVREVFTAIAKEARASGYTQVLGPVFDLARDPRFGRVEEMYSEDPFLVGELGLSAVQGLQGTAPSFDQNHVIATAKHLLHGQPENGTNVGPSDFSERTIRDTFLPPFEKAVRIGRIGAVMPSYNENNGGIPSHADSWLLRDVLRGEWGFGGLTVSDWTAIAELHTEQGVASSNAEAGVLAMNAGVDMELPSPVAYPSLAAAVRSGAVPQANLDAAVRRVLSAKFRAGVFERPLADPARAAAIAGAREHAALARRAADEAMVLLKNEGGALPLDAARIKSLAVIGPNAAKLRLGTYSGVPPYEVTVLDGIRKRLGAGAKVTYAEGVRISEPDLGTHSNRTAPYDPPSPEKDAQLIEEAVATAGAADTVVLVIGGNEAVSREAFPGHRGGRPALGDTDTLELPGRQNELIRRIAALGKPMVAVVLGGRPYSFTQLNETVPGIIQGWYLGQETGNAVAGVLFGDVNPSGRLPVTMAKNVGQLPVYYYKTPTARLGYVFNSNAPMYPFGYGLSYTTFQYGKPQLARMSIGRGEGTRVSVSVTNSGRRAGSEVVQLYVRPKYSSVVQPVKRLAGFERVQLKPGQTRTVSFALGAEQLAIVDREMKRTVEPGPVEIMIGPNAEQTSAVHLQVSPKS